MADDTNTAEREAIIRAAVAAMPHTNPLVADDLLGGFTMHTEADDIVAIFQAGRASLAASAGSEPVANRAFLERALSAMESVIDVADRNTTEFDALRSCVVDLTLMLFKPQACYSSPPEGMAGWKPIATAPKDGTLILVNFKSKGVRAVSWDSPFHDEVTEENGIWCVDDDKHGPYGLRGYNDDGPTAPTHWMPLPAPPLPASEAKEL